MIRVNNNFLQLKYLYLRRMYIMKFLSFEKFLKQNAIPSVCTYLQTFVKLLRNYQHPKYYSYLAKLHHRESITFNIYSNIYDLEVRDF